MEGKFITPLIITGEGFPPDPMNRRWMEGVASSEQCNISGAKPFIMLTSEEVELLESYVQEIGVDKTIELLSAFSRRYYDAPALYDVPSSFKNFSIESGLKASNNKFLHTQLDVLSKGVQQHMIRTDGAK